MNTARTFLIGVGQRKDWDVAPLYKSQ